MGVSPEWKAMGPASETANVARQLSGWVTTPSPTANGSPVKASVSA